MLTRSRTTQLRRRAGMLTLFALAVAGWLPAAAAAQTITSIAGFVNADNGTMPYGPIAQGRDGNLYGTTYGSGNLGGTGSFYSVTPAGVLTVLHDFSGTECQEANGVSLGTDGNFYGTCFAGGANSLGSIIKITPTGTVTVLHSFTGTGTDGCFPFGVPVQANDGNYYGTTKNCGSSNEGMAYKVTAAGTFTSIHSFTGAATDSAQPTGSLILGADGNLWGTGYQGGSAGLGNVFKMTTAGAVTSVFSFTSASTQGQLPYAGVVLGKDGNYYGVAQQGGANLQGTIFKLTPGGAFTLLHNFNLSADNGAYPAVPLALGNDGNLYGIGSDCISGGCGNADMFEITTKGTFTNLFNFVNYGGNNNSLPFTPLQAATSGTFYTTTMQGQSSTNEHGGTVVTLTNGQKAFARALTLSGKVGSSVGFLGQNFAAATVVKFGGVSAVTKLVGAGYVTATVPAGALSTNPTVTTGSTVLTALYAFKVTPTLTSFTPPSGPVGTLVTLNGTGLTQTTAVTFNNTAAAFTVVSDSQVTATVPAGATTGKIKITTAGGSVTSSTNFTVN